MTAPYGATRDEWDNFSLLLGLTGDLLPVVSNPDAEISPDSKMRSLGKTPSRYNKSRKVAGIAQWTSKVATPDDIAHWSSEPDYGICIQTRTVRALDVDIDNTVLAKEIYEEIRKSLGLALPTRSRANTGKFLAAFTLPGDFTKRIIRTDSGIIEFLATGQQFIAAGTHPSGERYVWSPELPDDIPCLTAEQFERLWARLVECYAADGTATVSAPSSKSSKLTEAAQNDPVAKHLFDKGVVVSTERDGRLHIICPFESEHTAGGDASATTYFPAFTGGYKQGHFRCLHAHCAERTDGSFLDALGIPTSSTDDFDILSEEAPTTSDKPDARDYVFEPWENSINQAPPSFVVKGVIPEAGLVVIFGESGSGKTFFALDIACSVARGEPWRGLAVKQGAVAYIAAEDVSGVRMRVKAYTQHYDVKPGHMPLAILGASPNFTKSDDVRAVLKALRAYGPVRLIFVDTWAQVTAGANENSGEDMGTALGYCRSLHQATGAVVVLIHHSGKDSSKGARGWSGLRAAADGEIEVTRSEHDREAEVTKLKNAADGERFGFKLMPLVVGQDDEGEDVSSCVLEHGAVKPKSERARREPKGVNEKIVLRTLNDLSIGGAVQTADVIDAAVNHMPFDGGSGKRDQRRKDALRALNSLNERGLVGVEGGLVSLKGEE